MKSKLLILTVALTAVLFAGCGKITSQQTQSSLPGNKTLSSTNKAGAELENKLVALGSSLTQASNLSTDKQGENEEYSFSTGTKIDSLYLYLKKKYPGLSLVNLASPGAEMKDILERQLDKALSKNPKFISIDPGADIVSRNPSVANFKQNLSQIMQKIDSNTTVFLFTYPNFLRMREANYASCGENKVGVSLENLSQSNVGAFNKAIKEAAAQYDNVILADIYDLLGPDDISDYDCLHINVNGQKKIAQQFINLLNQ